MDERLYKIASTVPLQSGNVTFTIDGGGLGSEVTLVSAPSGGKRIVPVWMILNSVGGAGGNYQFDLKANGASTPDYLLRKNNVYDLISPIAFNWDGMFINHLPAETALVARVFNNGAVDLSFEVGYYLV